jgi:hypothetical protein
LEAKKLEEFIAELERRMICELTAKEICDQLMKDGTYLRTLFERLCKPAKSYGLPHGKNALAGLLMKAWVKKTLFGAPPNTFRIKRERTGHKIRWGFTYVDGREWGYRNEGKEAMLAELHRLLGGSAFDIGQIFERFTPTMREAYVLMHDYRYEISENITPLRLAHALRKLNFEKFNGEIFQIAKRRGKPTKYQFI